MKPYRPSNGTEGMEFMDKFCQRCVCCNICKISINSMIYDIDDPKYPKQWIYGEDENPTCTAFKTHRKKKKKQLIGEELGI